VKIIVNYYFTNIGSLSRCISTINFVSSHMHTLLNNRTYIRIRDSDTIQTKAYKNHTRNHTNIHTHTNKNHSKVAVELQLLRPLLLRHLLLEVAVVQPRS
jgi:hypothetical protein